MDKYLDDLCDELDAAVFTGDRFHKEENRKGFREYMARWERELKLFDKMGAENTDGYECAKGTIIFQKIGLTAFSEKEDGTIIAHHATGSYVAGRMDG